jgi:hypothetical protein
MPLVDYLAGLGLGLLLLNGCEAVVDVIAFFFSSSDMGRQCGEEDEAESVKEAKFLRKAT